MARKGQEVTLADGSPLTTDYHHINPNTGQQKNYVVLSGEERDKGFVRPVRDAYMHLKCGSVTTMGRSIAETYARDPSFYGATFCVGCKDHFPVGDKGEFIWYDDSYVMYGAKVKVGQTEERSDLFKKERFLSRFNRTLSVKKSAESVGVTVEQAYFWKRDDEVFSDAWEYAVSQRLDRSGLLIHY